MRRRTDSALGFMGYDGTGRHRTISEVMRGGSYDSEASMSTSSVNHNPLMAAAGDLAKTAGAGKRVSAHLSRAVEGRPDEAKRLLLDDPGEWMGNTPFTPSPWPQPASQPAVVHPAPCQLTTPRVTDHPSPK